MNRIHKTVFNQRLGIWQVASEMTAARGKSTGRSSSGLIQPGTAGSLMATGAVALALGACALPAWSASCTVGGVAYGNCTRAADGGDGGTAPSTAAGTGSNPGSNGGGAGGGLSANGSNAQGSNGGAGGVTESNLALGGGAGSVATDGRGGGGGGGEGSETHTGGGGGGGGDGGTVLSMQTSYAADTAVLGGNGGAGGAAYDALNTGGGGGGGGGGGAGVLLLADRLDTSAYIKGGDGGAGGDGVLLNAGLSQPTQAQAGRYSGGGGAGGAGGAGIVGDFNAVTELINRGTISGGMGGAAGITATPFTAPMGGAGGAGGSAITGTGAGLIVRNEGTLLGGDGGASAWGEGSFSPQGAVGGHGIAGNSWSIDNSGTISGGAGGNGLTNQGLSTDGTPGGDGGSGIAGNDLIITNTGIVNGGLGGHGGTGGTIVLPFGSYPDPGDGGAGGSGITGSGLTLLNSGTISGGAGGIAGNYSLLTFILPMSGGGGSGVSGTDLSITNEGDISGGLGGYKSGGGSGISATGQSTITNSGTISGGDGRENNLGLGIAGGNGISGSGLILVNTGTIRGGQGGDGNYDINIGMNAAGGKGGSGISLTGNSSVTTSGLIAGGQGGTATMPPNTGMSGVNGASGNAVNFSGGGNTLTLAQGYSFIGNVISTSGNVNGDTLALGGNTNAATAFDVSNIVATLPATYSGTQYVGFSRLQKTGTSSWTLTGTGSAGTDWTIVQGTLRGDASALAGNITFAPVAGNSAAVVFDQGSGNANGPASASYAGTISGNGSLSKTGDGSLTLTGDNSYSGGTTISGGTLRIGDGGTSGSISGDVINNSILVFDRSDASSLAGTVSGSGSLIKRGTGVLAITGNNGYSGNTIVSAGTLQFGSYTQDANQTLDIGARSNSDYGKLNVTGAATFAAGAKIAVDVAGINSLASGQTLASVISAGALNASTFNVSDNSALFDFRARRNGNIVNLQIFTPTSTGVYDAVFSTGAHSTFGAARTLDAVIAENPDGDMGTVVTALGQLSTRNEVSHAVAQTLPLLSGGITQTTLGVLSSFNSVVQARLGGVTGSVGMQNGASGLSGGDTLSAFSDKQAWAKAFGSLANQHDADGASGFSSESWGMAFGVDGELDRHTRIGVAYAYANSSVSGNKALSGTSQHANVDSHLLALYGSRTLKDDLQLDWQADIGRNGIDGSRQIGFGGLNRTAESSHASYSAHVGAGLSKEFALDAATTVAPGIRADYTWLRDERYRESGADTLNLNVDSNTTEAFVLMAEGRVRHALSERSHLDANLGVGYDLLNDRNSIVSTYAGAPGQAFTTRGIDQSPWIVSGGIGYTLQANQNTQITLRYDAEGRDDYLNQTASVRANWTF